MSRSIEVKKKAFITAIWIPLKIEPIHQSVLCLVLLSIVQVVPYILRRYPPRKILFVDLREQVYIEPNEGRLFLGGNVQGRCGMDTKRLVPSEQFGHC